MSSQNRGALLAEIIGKLRQSASLSIVMGQAAADCLGINATDLNVLNIVGLKRAVAPSELAALTGLTTASITGVVDRLETAGFVVRERDESDRRKVWVKPVEAAAKKHAAPIFAPVMSAWHDAVKDFSNTELETIIEHYNRIEVVTRDLLSNFNKCAGTGQAAFSRTAEAERGQEPDGS